MGIHGLMKLLSDECPGAIKEQELSNLTGRKIAVILFVLAFIVLNTVCVQIDASMALYQFLIAVRSSDGGQAAMLTNEGSIIVGFVLVLYCSYSWRSYKSYSRNVQSYYKIFMRWS